MRALRKLNVSYNPIMSGMSFADDECAMVGGGIDDSYENPDTFDEAWNHPDTKDKNTGGPQLRTNLTI